MLPLVFVQMLPQNTEIEEILSYVFIAFLFEAFKHYFYKCIEDIFIIFLN